MAPPMLHMGCGVGLRSQHFAAFAEGAVQVDWVEAISENFMMQGGRALSVLDAVRCERPVALHGVAMCIGSRDPINPDYIRRLKSLITRVEPAYVSDHLSWGSLHGAYVHDLLPLPMTEETLKHVISRIHQAQEMLGHPLVFENVSSYIRYSASDIPEWEFVAAVAQGADCGILLDVNNVYVNAKNHGFDAQTYIDAMPAERVVQLHMAGHTDCGTHLLDTHKGPISDTVWSLYRHTIQRFGAVSTLIEWDEDVPDIDTLLAEAAQAEAIVNAVRCAQDNAA